MDWLPKLGEKLLSKEPATESAARQFTDAGFDLDLTLLQSPGTPGDKNNEEPHLQLSKGRSTMGTQTTDTNASSSKTHMPPEILAQIEELRRAGVTVGIPLTLQFDDKALATMQKPTPGQDLARFTAKASIATALGLGAALTFWLVTKPAEPML